MMNAAYQNTQSFFISPGLKKPTNQLSSANSLPHRIRRFRRTNRPYHTSGCQTPASHEIRPQESMWDLWRTKWHCSRFIAEKFGSSPPTNHSSHASSRLLQRTHLSGERQGIRAHHTVAAGELHT